MLPDDCRVVHVGQAARVNLAGAVQQTYRVQFMVGDNGPFTVELSAGEYTPENVAREVEKVAAVTRMVAPRP